MLFAALFSVKFYLLNCVQVIIQAVIIKELLPLVEQKNKIERQMIWYSIGLSTSDVIRKPCSNLLWIEC